MNKFTFNLKKFLSKKQKPLLLNIVGVGPGDSSLLTNAAIKTIKKSTVIFYPISGEDKKSYAAEIVKKYIRFKKQIPIVFPMARKEFNAEEIWSNSTEKIVKHINNRESVVLLCLGDPSIFGSSSYISEKIRTKYPEILIKTMPGISSISAGAAIQNLQLLKQGEILKVLECPNNQNEFNDLLQNEFKEKNVLVLMKIGKRWIWLKDLLKERGIIDKCF